MHERIQDAITYVRHFGRPDLFITFTCNPNWPEIVDLLNQGQKSHNRHDIIARAFRVKIRPESIDKVICAELSDSNLDPAPNEIIRTTMIHSPCGHFNKSSSCMLNGTCTKKYPRGFRKETQRREDGHPQYRRKSLEDGGVVTQITKKIMLTIRGLYHTTPFYPTPSVLISKLNFAVL
ncbi:helitron_like_N domain-containing protein [Trichonephila clavipes]|nr:helitron_like_N domain-containing protein [Trichonephila clavipes]